MQVEKAIVLSLSEPRNFTQLFSESRKLRKEYGESLSRDTFTKSLKSLRNGKVVNRGEPKGREVIYTLNLDEVGRAGKATVLLPQEDQKMEWLKKIIGSLDPMYKKILNHRGKKDAKTKKKIEGFQILLMNVISLIMAYQKNSFFKSNWYDPTTVIGSRYKAQNKKFSQLVNRLSEMSMTIDPSVGIITFLLLGEEASNQIDSSYKIMMFDFKRNEKYLFS